MPLHHQQHRLQWGRTLLQSARSNHATVVSQLPTISVFGRPDSNGDTPHCSTKCIAQPVANHHKKSVLSETGTSATDRYQHTSHHKSRQRQRSQPSLCHNNSQHCCTPRDDRDVDKPSGQSVSPPALPPAHRQPPTHTISDSASGRDTSCLLSTNPRTYARPIAIVTVCSLRCPPSRCHSTAAISAHTHEEVTE